jgi:hypothetical protein
MKSEFGIRMSLYISISFKKWKSLYCSAVVVALKSSMCSCIRSTKKSMILGNRISLAVVCGCVCVYDLYNCIIWNNRVFSVGAVAWFVWLIYIFFYIVVCINVYVFTLMLVCGSSESPLYLYDFSLLFIQSNSVLSSSPSTACSLSRDSIYR